MTRTTLPSATLPRRSAPATVLALAFLAAAALPARAQVSCSASSSTVNFGDVNPFGTADVALGGSVTATCTNSSTTSFTRQVCFEVGTGTGGTSGADRAIRSGSGQALPVRIFSPAGAATQVGMDTTWPRAAPRSITIPARSSGSVTFPFSVVLPAPSATAPGTGTFTSTFTGTAFNVFGSVSGQTNCAAIAGADKFNAPGTLTVQARVLPTCTITASALNFGSTSTLASPLNATAALTLRCNVGMPVTVSMDNGAGGGTGPIDRRMAAGANRITYGIYRDAAFALPWGATVGSNTASVNATAGNTSIPVYGRVPAQAAPRPGTYLDTVIVTATY